MVILLWEQDVAGSNPAAPTRIIEWYQLDGRLPWAAIFILASILGKHARRRFCREADFRRLEGVRAPHLVDLNQARHLIAGEGTRVAHRVTCEETPFKIIIDKANLSKQYHVRTVKEVSNQEALMHGGVDMFKKSSRLVATTLASLMALLLLWLVPMSNAATPTPRYGDSMVIGLPGDPGTLNGAISASVVEKIVASNVLSLLIRLDRNFNPVPDLAKTWSISGDGLTYTFKLQEGVKWHDGTPFSSADVKYTIEEVILPLHTRGGTYKSVIDKVETPDANTLIIRMKAPFGPLMNAMGYDFYILPKHLYQGTDVRNNPYNAKPVGTGPFKFKEWKRGTYVILERNPDYFRKGLPYLDRLVFQVLPDAAARVLALESGDIDYLAYQAMPSSAVSRLKTNPKLVVSQDGFESLASIEILTFNLDNPILKDVHVRQAIAYAVDKQAISERADYGIGKPATGPIASVTAWAYEPNVNKYPYDPTKAAKLLDDAGYKQKADGTRMTLRLVADSGVELNRKACEIVKEQLAQVGIKLDLQLVERSVMLDRVYTKRDFDLNMHGFSTGADPAIDVSRLYISTNIRPMMFTNGSGYRNQKVDELFAQGAKAFQSKDRAKAYKEVQKILTDDLPVVWLVEYGIVGAWSKNLHGLHTWSSYSYYQFWDTWSENAKRTK
jgi:peptide/nickel transport system substrate-binding protein